MNEKQRLKAQAELNKLVKEGKIDLRDSKILMDQMVKCLKWKLFMEAL